ncbi:hypothetical protein ACQKNS_03455 [Peribacillus sp. NPDC094092]|uniref:hypothetical protein n=1 Tax=Peribacillus sp. NPDC094092 TaxID=3390611 RepID=UPI003D041CC2
MYKSVEYATKVLSGEIVAPSQVKKACENFLHEYNVLQHQDDYDFKWNDKIELIVDEIIKQLNFARGAKSAQPMHQNLALFQWFLIQNTFCWVYKEFPTKRKVREVIFTVARKNAKSVLSCIIQLIAFFLDEEIKRITSARIPNNKPISFLRSLSILSRVLRTCCHCST